MLYFIQIHLGKKPVGIVPRSYILCFIFYLFIIGILLAYNLCGSKNAFD